MGFRTQAELLNEPIIRLKLLPEMILLSRNPEEATYSIQEED